MKKEEITKIINKEGSKSSKMLALYRAGMEIKDIAALMNVRYNFVYNVVSNDCIKSGEQVRTNKKVGEVRQQVIALIAEGKTNREIQAEVKRDYSYIWKIRKEVETAH